MTLVDDGGSVLEACPDLFAKVAGYRTCLAEVLVQLLQLAECDDDVSFICQFLSCFTQSCLAFQVLLEVVGTQFVAQFERVVECLNCLLVGLPEVGSLLGRHFLDVIPLLLELLEVVVPTVDLIRILRECLYLVDDFEFLLIVCLAFLFQSGCCSGTLLTDGCHQFLEGCFFWVGLWSVLLGTASFIDELLVGGICFSAMDAIEVTLEAVEFLASDLFVAF